MADRMLGPDEDPLADYHPDGSVDGAPPGESWDSAAPVPAEVEPHSAGVGESGPAGLIDQQTDAAAVVSRRRSPVQVPEGAPQGLNPIEASAETAVLAAILTSPETYDDLCEKLASEDFGVPAHAAIFAAVVACDASGRPFDPITVADEMSREGTLARSGGTDYLNAIVASEPELENLGAYVDIIIDRSLRRRMVNASRLIGQGALDPRQDAVTALNAAEHTVFELGQKRSGDGPDPMPVLVAKLHQAMARAREGALVGFSTGIDQLDELTGGLRGGQFVIIAARPAMGKSVLATQIGRHISQTEDRVVPILTYEMTQEEVGYRLLAAAAGVDSRVLERGIVPAGKDLDIARESEKLAQLRLVIDDKPPQTISGIRSAMRRLARRGPLGPIVVDYLQLVNGDGTRRNESRQEEVSNISRQLKLLAAELDVPIIGVSQLSRNLESRPNRRPLLSDLRESGSLEQDANLVLFLYREHVYDRAADESHAELIVAKNRGGPTGTIPLDWEPKFVRFTNSSRSLDSSAGFGGVQPSGGFGGGGGGFGGGGANVVKPDIF